MATLSAFLMMLASPFLRYGWIGVEVLGTVTLVALVLIGFFVYVMVRYPKRRR
ncbi:hypothetical protein LMG19282_01445 [Cupriavidus campinensis]|uniref:hypothetical protein n=1 Tax=Cupriavidus campinensis TaxID=151783 RepID=UPI00164242F0|nr:hypothetical protein [Cupriavidus campinensis]CAG2138098.1 hypothetical protein LMG19282_01445 [Cupriavidus campinensis]